MPGEHCCWMERGFPSFSELISLPSRTGSEVAGDHPPTHTTVLRLDPDTHPSLKPGTLSRDSETPPSALSLGSCVGLRSQEGTALRMDPSRREHLPLTAHIFPSLLPEGGPRSLFSLRVVSGILSLRMGLGWQDGALVSGTEVGTLSPLRSGGSLCVERG